MMANEKKIKINLIEIYPVIKDKIDNGGNVQLPITGISMRPLLRAGRDTVELVKCESPKKGDIIFYLRDNGQFVLHRIVGTDENGFVLCGDNQWYLERGVKNKHIIAVVKSITRKGKIIEATNPLYKAYSNIWMAAMPIRKYILKATRKLKTIVYNALVKLGFIKKSP
ncbi:MAG: S24/S26 family peptidase [Clostridia bacterium]|nr:S24/S26 family peptidase [Clostridia bacterium]